MEIQKQYETLHHISFQRHMSVVQRLAELVETGELPEKMAAKHIGGHLLKWGRIRATPVAKNMIRSGELESLPATCEGCVSFPDCLTEHHERWPKVEYEDPIRFAFRELPENKVMLCEQMHKQRHKREIPPPVPPQDEMVEAIMKFAMGHDPDFGQAVAVMIRSTAQETAA